MANLGFVRRCIDRRYGAGTREAFEQATGLGPAEYWDEAIAGGAAVDQPSTGLDYAVDHGANVFGWQAHLDHCGGQPGVSDEEIEARLDAQIAALKEQYPGRHFKIIASDAGMDIQEV